MWKHKGIRPFDGISIQIEMCIHMLPFCTALSWLELWALWSVQLAPFFDSLFRLLNSLLSIFDLFRVCFNRIGALFFGNSHSHTLKHKSPLTFPLLNIVFSLLPCWLNCMVSECKHNITTFMLLDFVLSDTEQKRYMKIVTINVLAFIYICKGIEWFTAVHFDVYYRHANDSQPGENIFPMKQTNALELYIIHILTHCSQSNKSSSEKKRKNTKRNNQKRFHPENGQKFHFDFCFNVNLISTKNGQQKPFRTKYTITHTHRAYEQCGEG